MRHRLTPCRGSERRRWPRPPRDLRDVERAFRQHQPALSGVSGFQLEAITISLTSWRGSKPVSAVNFWSLVSFTECARARIGRRANSWLVHLESSHDLCVRHHHLQEGGIGGEGAEGKGKKNRETVRTLSWGSLC